MNPRASESTRVVHVGVVGDLPGGMAQVISGYTSWTFEHCSVSGMRSTRGKRDILSPLTWIRCAASILGSRFRAERTVYVFHLSQGGSFLREGSLAGIAKWTGNPVGIHLHGSNFDEFAGRHPGLVRNVLRAADTIFVLTEQALASVSRAVPSNTKVVQTRNGVAIPPPTFAKEKIILFGGEVSERKGADVLIESWSSLREQTHGWKLIVAGPVKIATDGCESNVEFLGPLAHDSMLDLQRRASVAVLPSRAEALPMFLLESMANGCAVIATPVGQVEKLITGCGLVVETGSASSLVTALNACITDPEAARRLGERGRERVIENFSDQVVRDELERHWLEMKNRRREKNGAQAILVASTGGHLAQLNRLQGRLGIDADPLWITFDHPQSRSMLKNSRVAYVPYIAPRDVRGLLRALPKVIGSIRKEPANVVISTGAAIALLALPIAVLFGRRAVYVESVSRFDGPSLSGRILAKVPGVETYTQHKSWASDKWAYRTSVLQDYSATPQTGANLERPRVFVTLGTIKPYRFDRLVDALLAVLPSDAEVIWQMGVTQRDGLPGEVHSTLTRVIHGNLWIAGRK